MAAKANIGVRMFIMSPENFTPIDRIGHMFRADDLLEREDLASVRLLAPIFSLAARANAKPVLTFTCDLLTHPRQVHRKWNIGGEENLRFGAGDRSVPIK